MGFVSFDYFGVHFSIFGCGGWDRAVAPIYLIKPIFVVAGLAEGLYANLMRGKFASKQGYAHSLLRNHPDALLYGNCWWCGQRGLEKTAFNEDYSRYHKVQGPTFLCSFPDCDREFPNWSKLRAHFIASHLGDFQDDILVGTTTTTIFASFQNLTKLETTYFIFRNVFNTFLCFCSSSCKESPFLLPGI